MMKTKINFKKGITLLVISLTFVSCGLDVIPTLVTKDVSLGLLTVNGLQDETLKVQAVTIDLSKFIKDDEFDALETVELKEFEVTLNADYKNTVTGSEDFIGIIAFYLIEEGKPFTIQNYFNHTLITANPPDGAISSGSSILFEKQTAVRFTIENSSYNIKDVIIDKKVKLGVLIIKGAGLNISPFNDDFFSFTLKAKTEVQIN